LLAKDNSVTLTYDEESADKVQLYFADLPQLTNKKIACKGQIKER
jgi:hypothetical protein